MTYNEFEQEVVQKAVKAFELHRNLHVAISPLRRPEKGFDEYNEFVLVQLLSALFSTGESILILMTHTASMEADALLRSVFEGTVKYIYMMKENLLEESILVNEYFEILPELQKIKEHEMAQESKNLFDEWGIEKHPFEASILSDEEYYELENKYSKSYIKKLSQKWSYKRIIEELIKIDPGYRIMIPTLYEYGKSSHLVHYDGNSLKARIEDIFASDYEFQYAYALRIISNVLQLQLIRVSEYLRVYQLPNIDIVESLNSVFSYVQNCDDECTIILQKYNNN